MIRLNWQAQHVKILGAIQLLSMNIQVNALNDNKIYDKYFEEIEWVEHQDHYLSKHTKNGKQTFPSLQEAKDACLMLPIDECAGVTQTKSGFQPRKGSDGKRPSKWGETTFLRQQNEKKCKWFTS